MSGNIIGKRLGLPQDIISTIWRKSWKRHRGSCWRLSARIKNQCERHSKGIRFEKAWNIKSNNCKIRKR